MKLKAAYDVGLLVILPLLNKVDVDRGTATAEWLVDMLSKGMIQYADDVLDVLRLALEGRYFLISI